MTVLQGGIPDRVPVCLENFMQAAAATGYTVREYCGDGEKMAEAHIAIAQPRAARATGRGPLEGPVERAVLDLRPEPAERQDDVLGGADRLFNLSLAFISPPKPDVVG